MRTPSNATRWLGVSFFLSVTLPLSLTLPLSCGGRAIYVDGERVPRENPNASGGQSGAAGSPNLDCGPVLGADTVAHACSHTNHGPYVPTVMLDSSTPDVSELHKVFDVLVLNRGSSLEYRPSREGEHVLLTDSKIHVSVIESDSLHDVTGAQFAVADCDTIAFGNVAMLSTAKTYRFAVSEPEGAQFRLFVEYPPAFGERAWEERCDD